MNCSIKDSIYLLYMSAVLCAAWEQEWCLCINVVSALCRKGYRWGWRPIWWKAVGFQSTTGCI